MSNRAYQTCGDCGYRWLGSEATAEACPKCGSTKNRQFEKALASSLSFSAAMGLVVEGRKVIEWSWPWLILTGLLTIGFSAATADLYGWLSFLIGLAGGAVTFYTGYRAALAVIHRVEREA
jgi:hypothetical protein